MSYLKQIEQLQRQGSIDATRIRKLEEENARLRKMLDKDIASRVRTPV